MNLILDSSNLIHRAFWVAKQQPLINSKGEDVGCIFKFLRSLLSLQKQFSPNKFYAIWDKKETYGSGEVSYRVSLTEGAYKAGRDKTEQHNIYAAESQLINITDWLGIRSLYPYVLEADDVIGWLSNRLAEDKEQVTIISSDKDFLQLVSPYIQVFSPAKKQIYTMSNFKQLVGIEPNEYLYYKALVGDVADNLKSSELIGIGPKGAVKVIRGEKCLSGPQKQEVGRLMHLMDLKQGLIEHPQDITFCEEQFEKSKDQKPDFAAFRKYCEENEFKSILKDFDRWKSAFSRNRLVDLIGSLSK